jgi:hypothetical protein
LLAQSVVRDFGGRARFVVENYGSSELARRNGVTFYPALFVDDILVATPRDFYNPDEAATGRYIPFKTAASHERFREDLSRMIALILAGRKDAARAEAAPAATSPVESPHAGGPRRARGRRRDMGHLVSPVPRLARLARWPSETLR